MKNQLAKIDLTQLGDHAGTMIAAIFTGLSANIMSGDVLWLSFHHARHIAKENGVPEEDIDNFMGQIAATMEAARKGHPLSDMF